MKKFNAIDVARRVIKIETDGMAALAANLDASFTECVALIQTLKGHVVLAGVGKSGHVGRKISATLSSTGTPSLFVHPTEASHGDMGMITKDDCVIALSRSGETKELADMIGYCKRFAVPLIAMTCKAGSTLAKSADHVLLLPDTPEACAVTGAPTTSTTLQIALGDARRCGAARSARIYRGRFQNISSGRQPRRAAGQRKRPHARGRPSTACGRNRNYGNSAHYHGRKKALVALAL